MPLLLAALIATFGYPALALCCAGFVVWEWW